MAIKNRKLFRTNQTADCSEFCYPSCPYDCYSFPDFYFPPPPPPPHSHQLSPLFIVLIALFVSLFILLSYYILIIKSCAGCTIYSFIALKPEKEFKINNLFPSTEYFFKVSLFSSTQVLGILEAKWVTPKLSGLLPTLEKHTNREIRSVDLLHSRADSKNSLMNLHSLDGLEKNKCERFYKNPSSRNSVTSIRPASVCPSTPCKLGETRVLLGLNCKKRAEETDYEYSVRMVKWLEHEGHIDEDFRVKFLTWFSLKASVKDRRVVSAFTDALIDDPPSLAGQLGHTFMDEISCNQKPVSQHEYCEWIWR